MSTRTRIASLLGALALTIASVVNAATFNLFQPATGILKGNSSTYVTTAAASSDVIALWTGTCNASSFLRGDGSCAAPVGGVSSVGLTMPSGFSVGGSPVTSSGTLTVTTALTGVLAGNGSGFTTAAASDVISLWSGTCDATTFLRGDGSCVAAGGGGPTLGGNQTWTGDNTWEGEMTVFNNQVNGNGRIFIQGSGGRFINFTDGVGAQRATISELGSGNTGLNINAAASNGRVRIWSNNTQRISFDIDGSWDLNGTTPGSAGQVLTSGGSSAAPSWTTPNGAKGARFNASAGGCSVAQGDTGYFTACSRAGTGIFTVTTGTRTACTANADPTSGGGMFGIAINGAGPSFNVQVFNTAGTPVDGGFSLVCAQN